MRSPGAESYRFYSHYVSGAQRLANGNTMITEGADGRIFEVTAERRDRLGVREPVFLAERREQPRVPRLPRAVRMDSAVAAASRACGAAAEREGFQGS